MTGRWDWLRMQANLQHSAASKADQIMAKYRPIAPKPPLQTTASSSGMSTSHSIFSTLNTTHNGNGGHNRSGCKRKASDCFDIQAHSPRVPKKPSGVPSLGIRSIKQDTLFSRVEFDEHGVLQAPTPAKELEAILLERREANWFNGGSVLDERCGGSDGWVGVKTMESTGEVGVENLASKVGGDVSVAETEYCGCGSADFLGFPNAGVEEKNLVTLPLLPQTPQLHNISTTASNNASSHKEGSTRYNNGSSHKEGIPLRLFGRDLGHREVGSCQISSNENLKLDKVVPIVGLSFI